MSSPLTNDEHKSSDTSLVPTSNGASSHAEPRQDDITASTSEASAASPVHVPPSSTTLNEPRTLENGTELRQSDPEVQVMSNRILQLTEPSTELHIQADDDDHLWTSKATTTPLASSSLESKRPVNSQRPITGILSAAARNQEMPASSSTPQPESCLVTSREFNPPSSVSCQTSTPSTVILTQLEAQALDHDEVEYEVRQRILASEVVRAKASRLSSIVINQRQSRRRWWIMGALLLVVGVAAVVVGVVLETSAPPGTNPPSISSSPTGAPTTVNPRRDQLTAYLTEHAPGISSSYLSLGETQHAIDYVLNELGDLAIDDRAVQHVGLVAVYYGNQGERWYNSTGWLTEAPFCTWYGVFCDEEGYVTELRLNSNGVWGNPGFSYTLPASLGSVGQQPISSSFDRARLLSASRDPQRES